VTAALWDGNDGQCDHVQASQTRHSSARSISPHDEVSIDDLTTGVQHDEVFQAGYGRQQWLSSDAGAAQNYPPSREGAPHANQLRRRRAQTPYKWHLDEVFLKINAKLHYLWRAVDQHGNVLDMLMQRRRNKQAAKK
jgi:DDE domain